MKENEDIVKYGVPAGIIGFGLLMGGVLTQGIYAGILTCAGFWILIERLKDNYPAIYNWLLDHSVEADVVVSLGAAFVLGFTVTGIIGAAVVNLLCSLLLDHYRDNVGKVKEVESAQASDVIGFGVKKVKGLLTTIKDGIKKAKQLPDEIKENQEVENAI